MAEDDDSDDEIVAPVKVVDSDEDEDLSHLSLAE